MNLSLRPYGQVDFPESPSRMADGFEVEVTDALSEKERMSRLMEAAAKAGVTRVAAGPFFSAFTPRTSFTHIGDLPSDPRRAMHSGTSGEESLSLAIEEHCLKMRTAVVVRSSFRHLHVHQRMIDPEKILDSRGGAMLSRQEPLLWTHALHPKLRAVALVPADLVFSPIPSELYRVRPWLSPGRLGVGSGATYQEAAIRGMDSLLAVVFGGGDAAKEGLGRWKEAQGIREGYERFLKTLLLLEDLGFHDVFFANLTRIGIDWPVLRCVIPSMAFILRQEQPVQ